MYTVYSLVDPRDAQVRYVGITEDVYTRFSQHIRCEGNNIDKNEWIQELRDANAMVLMYALETVDTFDEAREREDYWTHYHLTRGANLLNIQIARMFTYDDFQSQVNALCDRERKIISEDDADRVNPTRGMRYVVSKKEATKMARCSLKEIETAIATGKLRTYKSDPNKVLLSSLKAYVPTRKRQAISA